MNLTSISKGKLPPPPSNLQSRFTYPRDFWKSKTNQREFLNNFAQKHEIKTPKDWASVSINSDTNKSGFSFVYHYYNNSLYDALKNIYPGTILLRLIVHRNRME